MTGLIRHRSARAGIAALAALAGVTAAGCGGQSTSSGTSAGTQSLAPLTVAVTSAVPEYGAIYIAKALGYFKSEGLTVSTLDVAGANGPNYLVAGTADLDFYSGPIAIGLKNQGEDVKIIGNNESFDGTSLVGNPKVPNLAALKALPNCRMGTTPVGTNNYFMAKQFIKDLGLNCTLVQYASPEVNLTAIVSGAVPVGVSAYNEAEVATKAGKVSMLVNSTSNSFRSTYVPRNLDGYIQIGLASDLAAKKNSIIAFEVGMIRGTHYMETHTTAQIAQVLRTQAAFKPTPTSTLALSIPSAVKFLPKAPNWGFISPSQWTYDLSQYPLFGVSGVTATDPNAQYGAIIDMSYYKAALAKIKSSGLGG